MTTPLTILIPTAGRPDLLERTLESLAACRRPAGYRETIVVENGPAQGAEAIVEPFREPLNACYLHTERANKSAALNLAMERIGDGLIVFLDDDVRLDAGVLEAYAEAAAGIEGGRFFGGPTGVDYELPPADWLRNYLPSSARGWGLDVAAATQVETPNFLGFNWAAFAGDLRRVGGFNPDRGPGSATGSVGQETEMQQRLLAGGVQGWYLPGAKVWHYVPAERCTEAWTLQRIYRSGVGVGLKRRIARNGHGNLLDRAPLRYRLKGWFTVPMATLSGNGERRFRARYWHRFRLGLSAGLRGNGPEDLSRF